MGITAQQRGIDLAGTTVTVQKVMANEPVRRIGRLALVVTVPKKISAEDQQRLERSARACPVNKSLHPDIDVSMVFNYGPDVCPR